MSANFVTLKILRDYLITVDAARFDMGSFWHDEYDGCGAVGCIIGHAVYSGIPELKPITFLEPEYGDKVPDFWKYAHDVLGITDEVIWNFLFASEWEPFDNSLQGAVERIDFFIAHPDTLRSLIGGNKTNLYMWWAYYKRGMV